MLQKRDWVIMGIVVCIAVLLLAVTNRLPWQAGWNPPAPSAEVAGGAAQEPAAEANPGGEAPGNTAPLPEAEMYLRVTVGDMQYEPVPLVEEAEYTLTQTKLEMENVIQVTPHSVWMASSSCDNQDCVAQGIVTSDNMYERLLSNMIVCLPNRVILELVPRAELEGSLP